MNFNKKVVASAIALAAMGLSHASDVSVTPYGKINITIQQTDDSSLDGNELKSNASRFGLKGKAKISDSLKAIYKLEWEVDTTDSSKSSDDHIKARNQFVGLAGGFGEFIAGRHDTPLKKSQGKVDLFNDLEGDIKHLFHGEVRASNFVQYTSPKFAGGLKIKAAALSANKGASETDTNDFGTGTSFAIEYSTKTLFVALAQDSDVHGNDTKTTRLTTSYKLDNWTFGAIYNEHDNGAFDEEGVLVSIAYQSGDHTFKLQTGESDDFWSGDAMDKTGYDLEMTSIGWDVKLGKTTKFFMFHTTQEDAGTTDNSWFGMGLEQKF